MTHRLTTNYAKNYCNRTLIVKVIVDKKAQLTLSSPRDVKGKNMQKLLQFDVFRFISPNSISPNFKL